MKRTTMLNTCAGAIIAAASLAFAAPSGAQTAPIQPDGQAVPPTLPDGSTPNAGQQQPAGNGQTNVTTTAAPTSDRQPDSQDIVVTALRKAESVLKTPATIAVIGGGDLKTVGVTNVNDLQNVVTGLNIGTGAFGTNISIRGVTSTDQTSKGELGIAFNIDGAFIGRGQEQGVAFFDLERVEVLKGPQGTLYGRSSTGGAINVITKKPSLTDGLSGYGRLEVGNYNTKRAEGAINIPITETLALRVAGNINGRDGFLTPYAVTVTGSPVANGGAGPNTINLRSFDAPAKNDQSDRTGRVSALWQPTSDVTATVIATVGHLGGVGTGGAIDDNLRAGGDLAMQVIPNSVPSFVKDDFYNFNEQLNWRLGGVQLDLLGNEQHFRDHTQTTGNGNPFDTGNPVAPASFGLDDYHGVFDTNQFEARISNVNPGFLEYVAGGNYYHEQISESDHNWTAPITQGGGLSPTSQWINNIDPVNTTTHKSYGVFAQVTLHLTPTLGIVGGARYTHDESTRIGTFAVGGVPGCTYPNNCIGGPNNGYESDKKVTWKGGVNWQFTPNDLLYASVSTGFKAGGFNDFDPRTNTTAPYGPESLTAYEVGYKGRPTSTLTVSASGYYYDYSADQINGLTLFLVPTGVVGVLFTQLAPVEIYGAEGDVRWQAARNTTFDAQLAYEHSRIISLKTGYLGYLTGNFANFRDYQLPNTPKFIANLSATQAFDLSGGAQLRLRAATKISSGYFLTDYANAVQYRQDNFTRTNLSLTYAAPGDRYTIQLFVENLENQLQRTSGPIGYNGTYGALTGGNPTPEANGTAFPQQSIGFGVNTPRFFGGRFGVKF